MTQPPDPHRPDSPGPDAHPAARPGEGAGTRAERRADEAAAIRRRWITLGELLALAAVVISALTLWSNWSDRQDSRANQAATARRASARAATLVLVAGAGEGERLALHPAASDQTVQRQSVRFPAALGLAPVATTGEPRIEADWFAQALQKARARIDLPDDSRGDEQLPLLIETRFLADGAEHVDLALYDLGYTIEGRLLRGHRLTLRGLSLVRRVAPARGAAALDARWARLFARPAATRD